MATKEYDKAKEPAYIKATPELYDKIIQLLIEGHSMVKIIRMEGMPCRKTLFSWRIRDEEFGRRVDEARKANIEFLVDDMLDIAREKPEDDMDAKGKRLYMDTLKWVACKIAPKLYGDRLAMTDADGGNLPPTEIRVTMVRPQADDTSTG
jgi:hypothetical protein